MSQNNGSILEYSGPICSSAADCWAKGSQCIEGICYEPAPKTSTMETSAIEPGSKIGVFGMPGWKFVVMLVVIFLIFAAVWLFIISRKQKRKRKAASTRGHSLQR